MKVKNLLVVVLLCGAVFAGAAEVPHLISFQGRLDDASGETVPDDVYSVTFRLYDDPVGGTLLWDETQDVTTVDGLFTVWLGGNTPIPDSAFDVDSCYLEIQLAGSDPIVPRARVTSVAYARMAGTANRLGTATAEDLEESAEITAAIAAHQAISSAHHTKTVSASELGTGTLAEARLPQNAIDSSEIEDNSLTDADLLDEPGISHTHPDLTLLSSTPRVIDSAMIIAPDYGYALVLANGWFYVMHFNGGAVSGTVSLSTSRTTHDQEHRARFEVGDSDHQGSTVENFSLSCVKTVMKGQQFKLFLLGSTTGNEFPNVQNVHINTLFIPTSYGEIDAVKSD
jgi:hypothetical protein